MSIRILRYDELDSTNDEAKRILRKRLLNEAERDVTSEDFVVIAERQSAGRGQRGRRFFSPPGSGLYMSICLRHKNPAGSSLVTQAAALAVCRSVGREHGISLSIKPVNDIIYRGKKAGGILVECDAAFGAMEQNLIVGIGLNLYLPDGGFPPELMDTAGHIFDEPVDKYALAATVADELLVVLKNYTEQQILEGYLNMTIKKTEGQ